MKRIKTKATAQQIVQTERDDDFEEFDYFGLGAPEVQSDEIVQSKDEITPFSFIESVSKSKIDLIKSADMPAQVEKLYNAYMVNRGLSYFADTVLHANEMNRLWHLPKDAQYRYFLSVLRPRDRRSKWYKAEKSDELDMIQQYFQCNRTVAKGYLKVLSEEDMKEINKKMTKGGS